MLFLIINGKEKEFSSGKMPETLSSLLDSMGINHATVVAEVNGLIVRRNDFAGTKLSDGQKIELVKFVGGG
ncbi:MAG: sulfur carrier protein ThiS [Sedimentisphaerales bacterium]|nr:sulfur carrier protein ThiS [Sedimentisphaerales bacterium]